MALIVDLKKPFLYLKIFQFVMGIIVYSLTFSQIWKQHDCLIGTVPDNITQVAAVAYPFVILPVIFICSLIQGQGLEKHLMCVLLSVGGFITSLIGGSLICAQCKDVEASGPMIAGAMTIIYSLAYLVDIAWFAYEKFFNKSS